MKPRESSLTFNDAHFCPLVANLNTIKWYAIQGKGNERNYTAE